MIELSNASLDYILESDDGLSLKKWISKFVNNKKSRPNKFRALKNLNFKINAGESVGIIGLNGAGKSTLLRLLSGIYQPTEGSVKVIGKISTLLDFATGFELHHTGYENVKIRLMFLGVHQDQVPEMIEEIREFSELGDFFYQPARTYSAGMFMRLAFAASTAISPEILIADEVVGAGDAQFAAKAQHRLERLLSGEQTTILSTHSMELLHRFCKRAIWLHHGEVIMDDSVAAVTTEYLRLADKMSRL